MRRHVLLVDDNPADLELLIEAFAEVDGDIVVEAVRSAEQAFAHLGGEGDPSGTGPRPGLVVLDLNMPGIDGLAALRTIKSRAAWSSIPVVIFSSTSRGVERESAMRLGAAATFVKPSRWADTLEMVKGMCRCLESPASHGGSPPG